MATYEQYLATLLRARASNQVAKALREGVLKLPKDGACEDCHKVPPPRKYGVRALAAHHADYDKPLEVRWLCKRCHVKAHWGVTAPSQFEYAPPAEHYAPTFDHYETNLAAEYPDCVRINHGLCVLTSRSQQNA